MPSVLFVCTANMSRSPMAQAFFQHLIDQGQLGPEWRVESAGTWGRENAPASSKAQAVLQEWGIDLSQHRSRIVDEAMLAQFDLILAMEKGHQEAMQIEFPRARARIHLLSEMVGRRDDVADPVGKSIEDYRATAQQIHDLIAKGLETIDRLATRTARR